MIPDLPVPLRPVLDDYNRPFYSAAAQGRLVVPRCAGCETPCWTPRSMCPRCHATAFEWIEVEPRGTIWSYCVVHPPVIPELAAETPFTVGVVSLSVAPAVHLVGRVTGATATFAIGMPVEATFRRVEADIGLVSWLASVS